MSLRGVKMRAVMWGAWPPGQNWRPLRERAADLTVVSGLGTLLMAAWSSVAGWLATAALVAGGVTLLAYGFFRWTLRRAPFRGLADAGAFPPGAAALVVLMVLGLAGHHLYQAHRWGPASLTQLARQSLCVKQRLAREYPRSMIPRMAVAQAQDWCAQVPAREQAAAQQRQIIQQQHAVLGRVRQ